jgi:hypothetical protein
MEEIVNKLNIEEKDKKTIKIKELAFEIINNQYTNFENYQEDNNNIFNNDKLPYNNYDFLLAKESSIKIREKNPINLLTYKIVNLYKKCQVNYEYEEIEAPKSELTNPSEGNIIN